jgi:hypothetical protein
MDEWKRSDANFSTRVTDLFTPGSGGANGPVLLDLGTVIPDANSDQLFGGTGSDWFWASTGKKPDVITGLEDGEVISLN